MSVQFGIWNFEGQHPTPDYIEKVNATLAPYGPDSDEAYSKGQVNILYRAFHTTKESHCETQPHICPSGAVITWDGRLDNRAELISALQNFLTISSTDVVIVAAAYEEWGTGCFARLIGDWALSIWNPNNRSLILAKAPIGTRHLYYSIDNNQVTWCTILDPLVLFADRPFAICEQYIAGWFATMFPAAHLTPYVGIRAIPPSSFVLLQPTRHSISKYWDFDPRKRIRYRTNEEYQEHFRSALETAVTRTLRSDRPVLAELSGGMDSSSIVCMADLVIGQGQADCPRLDTITWYDKAQPNWGELPYFTKVEEKRGRVGYHIDAGSLRENSSHYSFGSEFASNRFAATPTPNSRVSELFQQNAAYIKSQGYRAILSGIGGGEVTGDGVPSPTQEFQDLLANARFVTLSRQLRAWSAKMKKNWLPLLWAAVRQFSPLALLEIPEYVNPPAPWFQSGFVQRNRATLRGCPFRTKFFGPLPSFQASLRTLDADRMLLESWPLESELLREMRFPYFDRDLLEFMYAIPREQIVGVGQRRFLMKNALFGIVPDEILNRRKKQTGTQQKPKGISADWPSLAEVGYWMFSSSLGIIDPDRLLKALQNPRHNEENAGESLMRTLTLESWLRHLAIKRVFNSVPTKNQFHPSLPEPNEFQGSTQPKSLAS